MTIVLHSMSIVYCGCRLLRKKVALRQLMVNTSGQKSLSDLATD